MGFFLALVMFMGCLPLNTIETYATEGDVAIDEAHFPNENFRNYVSREFDTNKDGKLSKYELDKVEEINIANTSLVYSLKGIEYFKNLTKLIFYGNYLTELDVSKNINLTTLHCYGNNLKSLDVTKNTKLTELYCCCNNLKSLDVTKNTKLTKLYCSNNNLKSLDVRENINLTTLYCNNNNLKSLDVSKNKNLTELHCEYNKLTSLDLSKNTKLTYLNCKRNELTSLNVSKNTNLTYLDCNFNNLTSLDVRENTKLTYLDCFHNNLTSLDVSKNTKLTYLECRFQQYNITVIKGIREFKYSKFPGQFKKDKVISPVGASFGDDALTVDSDTTNKVNYKYKVDDNREMDVTLNITYIEFDPEHVESMVVKKQPKLIYTEGEKLDLSKLVVTLTDKQGLTKDVAFKDFEENNITANPENETELTLADNGKKVSLTKENSTEETEALTKDVAFRDFASNVITTNLIDDTALTLANNGKALKLTKGDPITAETEALTVNKKETPPPTPTPDPPVVGPVDPTPNDPPVVGPVDPTPNDPPVVGPVDPTQPGEKPADTSKYWTVTFKSEDETKGVVDAKNTVYVLKNSGKTLADLTKYAPKVTAKAGYEFDKWEPALDKNTVIDKDLTVKAYFKKVGSPTPQDPTDPPAPPQECWIVTFKSEDETKGTVDAKNRVAVLKNSGKTLADLAKYAPKVTAKAGYEFDKWEPALDKNTVIDKDMTVKAHFKKAGTPTPQDPPDPPQEYWTVTFESEDETKGTVDANNKVRVLKNSGKTLADLANDAPKVTAKAGFKFTGWEPALDKNTSINRNLTVNAKFEKVTPTPQDPPVVGPVDPTPQDPPVVGPVDPTPNDPPVVGPVDPTQPGGKPKVANNGKLPKTANSMNIELYTFLMILSAGLLVVAFKRKKRVNR